MSNNHTSTEKKLRIDLGAAEDGQAEKLGRRGGFWGDDGDGEGLVRGEDLTGNKKGLFFFT